MQERAYCQLCNDTCTHAAAICLPNIVIIIINYVPLQRRCCAIIIVIMVVVHIRRSEKQWKHNEHEKYNLSSVIIVSNGYVGRRGRTHCITISAHWHVDALFLRSAASRIRLPVRTSARRRRRQWRICREVMRGLQPLLPKFPEKFNFVSNSIVLVQRLFQVQSADRCTYIEYYSWPVCIFERTHK